MEQFGKAGPEWRQLMFAEHPSQEESIHQHRRGQSPHSQVEIESAARHTFFVPPSVSQQGLQVKDKEHIEIRHGEEDRGHKNELLAEGLYHHTLSCNSCFCCTCQNVLVLLPRFIPGSFLRSFLHLVPSNCSAQQIEEHHACQGSNPDED